MTYALELRERADGSVELVGEALERIRITQELLDAADPAVLVVHGDGGVTFTLANATLRYRCVGPAETGLSVEFERVA